MTPDPSTAVPGRPAAWGGWTRAALLELAASVGAVAAALALFTRFVDGVERRAGVVLPDPVLARLAPRDLTWVTFGVLYAGLVLVIATLSRDPPRLLRGLRAYAVMVLLRMAAMAVTPLDPPPGMIPLADPVVQGLGPHVVLTRDLFFSGHTATATIMALALRRRWQRALFGLGAAAIGGAVVWQHVHYSVDVLAAPAFAYAAWRIAGARDRLARG